jgi:hypothetical protein
MNSIHNNGENDKSLIEDIDKLGRSYAGLEQDEPPELLDRAILNSAHRALEKKSRWMKFSWVHGLTTAAVFVLALSLIINQREQSPGIPDGIEVESLSLPKLDVSAKKPSAETRSDDFRQVKKEKSAGRIDVLENTPAAAVGDALPATAPAKSSEVLQESIFVNGVSQADSAISDETDGDRPLEIEEIVIQEAEPQAGREESASVNELRETSAIGASPAIEVLASDETDPELEQQLFAIIQMKQSGDANWQAELQSFVENYPDYPLPDELSN